MSKIGWNHTKLFIPMRPFPILLPVLILAAVASVSASAPVRLTVSVAASIHDAMEEITQAFTAATGLGVDLNTGGSNTLARQIVDGARVDLFLSADDEQMDVVERAGLVVQGTRTYLLSNTLVVVVPEGATTPTREQLLAGGVRRLAMGEPSSVPVGVYGREWLRHEGAWERLKGAVVPFLSVRAVLTAVESGRVDAGIVYRTDALQSRTTVILTVDSAAAGIRIVQPAALIQGGHEAEARRLLDYLKGPAAGRVFARRGFDRP